jgi:hypothetical protein
MIKEGELVEERIRASLGLKMNWQERKDKILER